MSTTRLINVLCPRPFLGDGLYPKQLFRKQLRMFVEGLGKRRNHEPVAREQQQPVLCMP